MSSELSAVSARQGDSHKVSYPGILLQLDTLDVQSQGMARLGIVLDGMVAIWIGATAVEAGQADIKARLVILATRFVSIERERIKDTRQRE